MLNVAWNWKSELKVPARSLLNMEAKTLVSGAALSAHSRAPLMVFTTRFTTVHTTDEAITLCVSKSFFRFKSIRSACGPNPSRRSGRANLFMEENDFI